MKGKFGYLILKELNLILIKIEHDYTLDDIVIFKQKYSKDNDFNLNLKSLYDLRNSNYIGTYEQIDDFVDWIVKNGELYKSNNSSFLTTTPKQIVISQLITNTDKLKNNNYGDHCTLEGSLKFLDIDFSNFTYINSELEKISTTEL